VCALFDQTVLSQLFRYAVSGALASVINIGVYHLLASNGMDENLAWTIGFIGSMAFGFIIHSQWSFRGHGLRDKPVAQGTKFVIVSLFSFACNSFWVWLTVKYFGLPLWAPYPLALGVTPLLIFILNRRWVFK
jgi:putative flippase GtrA